MAIEWWASVAEQEIVEVSANDSYVAEGIHRLEALGFAKPGNVPGEVGDAFDEQTKGLWVFLGKLRERAVDRQRAGSGDV